VADFGEAMRQKLWKKLREGYGGWNDDTDPGLVKVLRDKLEEHVARYLGVAQANAARKTTGPIDPKQLVDIANLVMMLWRIEVQGKESRR
jgi:hypothetical protein